MKYYCVCNEEELQFKCIASSKRFYWSSCLESNILWKKWCSELHGNNTFVRGQQREDLKSQLLIACWICTFVVLVFTHEVSFSAFIDQPERILVVYLVFVRLMLSKSTTMVPQRFWMMVLPLVLKFLRWPWGEHWSIPYPRRCSEKQLEGRIWSSNFKAYESSNCHQWFP